MLTRLKFCIPLIGERSAWRSHCGVRVAAAIDLNRLQPSAETVQGFGSVIKHLLRVLLASPTCPSPGYSAVGGPTSPQGEV
jgi:hypothetical protein